MSEKRWYNAQPGFFEGCELRGWVEEISPTFWSRKTWQATIEQRFVHWRPLATAKYKTEEAALAGLEKQLTALSTSPKRSYM